MAILLLALLLVLLLSLPVVQTRVAKMVTNQINKKYKTDIIVKKVDLAFLGEIQLKGVQINDHHNDTLIFVDNLTTSILNYKNIIDNKLEFDEIEVEGLRMYMKTYKGEKDDNLSVFIDKFDDNNPKKTKLPFLLTSSLLKITNGNFYLYNENKQEDPIVYYTSINGLVEDFKIEGSNVFANVRDVTLVEDHGIEVTNLSTDFTYTKSKMDFKQTHLRTLNSSIDTDITFNYKREDLSDFTNKVVIDADVTNARVSLVDLHQFYDELGLNDKVKFTTKLTGTLNNFKLNNLVLESNRNSIVNGHFHFVNAVNRENGFSLKANINELSSTYQNLKMLLPNILGSSLPPALKQFGRFNVTGKSFITKKTMDADVIIKTNVGKIITDLKMTNIDDVKNAEYIGKLELVDVEFGRLIKDSLVGKLTLIADVKGKGFTLDKINTSIKGNIFKHQYKGYTYNNIEINGVFKNQHFDGKLIANDKNLQMTFKGLADLSSTIYKFDFIADVAYANFHELNLFKRDSISILKGKIDIKLKGNTLDNLAGQINFSKASYTNQNDNYFFTDFNVTSEFDKEVRTITVNSTDIIDGRIKGVFKFDEIGKLAANSLASIYTNYNPSKVVKGQFLDFNFKIYNKIVDVFFPDVKLDANSSIKGKINSDQGKFELTLKSPKLEAYGTLIENIRLQIDNKNPIYNTLLSVDKVNTKFYNIADLNLVNVTLNDTLFFRTDFIGGEKLKEKFDLSFYHTINENNKSVIGLKKSKLNFKGNNWAINPNNNNQNKVVFDKKFDTFAFDKFTVFYNNQTIDFAGVISGKDNKDITLNLQNVNLNGITPYIDNFELEGLVNGSINYKQKNGETFPLANVSVNEFKINGFEQGDLFLTAQGDNSIEKYGIAARLTKDGLDMLYIDGGLDFSIEQPTIFANFDIAEFNLNALSALGKDVITDIRGTVSGNGTLSGLIEDPDINGFVNLEGAGLKIPYLNVDFDLENNTKVKLTSQSFIFSPSSITDVDKKTKGKLSGRISHHNKFKKWFLDLKINTNNLLVLNTEEDEEMLYYGTAFMDGNASIRGYTDKLVIDVEGKTMPGTEFIVPLSEISTIGDSGLIKFVTETKDGEVENQRQEVIFDKLKGLTLNFDLEVTDDAIAEIVIDKNTGSVLRGKGNGYMGIEINTNGKFEIYGTYIVSDGIYEFRNIINKDFVVQPGGSVTWNGSPFDAFLNINAIYKTKANPSILLDNISSNRSNRKIDVNLVVEISGQLLNSDIDFEIELPNQNSNMKSELDFKLSNEDAKMTQFFSLLVTNSFLPLNEGTLAFDGNAALYGTLSEKINNVLSSMLKTKGDKFQLGLTYDIASRDDVRNYNINDQFGVSFSSTIADRVIINGKVGVPVGSNTQNNIVGEVEVELPINEEGTLTAKAYTRQNDIEYDVSDVEGYTSGVGLSWRVDFDNSREFLDKIFKNRDKKQENQKTRDSLSTKKKLINYTAKKKDSIKLN